MIRQLLALLPRRVGAAPIVPEKSVAGRTLLETSPDAPLVAALGAVAGVSARRPGRLRMRRAGHHPRA